MGTPPTRHTPQRAKGPNHKVAATTPRLGTSATGVATFWCAFGKLLAVCALGAAAVVLQYASSTGQKLTTCTPLGRDCAAQHLVALVLVLLHALAEVAAYGDKTGCIGVATPTVGSLCPASPLLRLGACQFGAILPAGCCTMFRL